MWIIEINLEVKIKFQKNILNNFVGNTKNYQIV